MSRKYLVILILLSSFLIVNLGSATLVCQAAADDIVADNDEYSEYDAEVGGLSDPLEMVNRPVFTFNDRLRLWILEPTARGYRKVTPRMFRAGLLNFFDNLLEPTRFINCLLQGRFNAAGETFMRFALNSTVGVGGLMDPATFDGMKTHERRFASTFAHYGIHSGPYLVLPFFGPSDLRGIFGLVGNTLTQPLFYILRSEPLVAVAVEGSKSVNHVSFRLGEYEKMISGALDPYVAVRDAYEQHQQKVMGEE
ncbi:MAG: VacJ family lipoprotein [Pseudomonadota bacterium]|nr:VacJ family lipoprotein [Pseudomonadota bacterium]